MPSKKSNQKLRASRPVNPRTAPGVPRRKGPDPFAVGLIAVSTVIALILIFIFANQNNAAVPAITTTASGTVVTTNPVGGPTSTDPNARATAAEVTFATQTAPLERISPQEALALYQAQNATIFDVRDETRYKAGHIKGAINIPEKDAGTRMAEFPKTGNVILYCQ